jgi:two-component system phosphate regulon sensor histidine kinase PhoR
MFGLGIFLGQIFKSFYTNTFHSRLEKEANLVALYLGQSEKLDEGLQGQMEEIGESLETRVTVMSPNGSIILDSEKMPEEISRETLVNYQDILQANKKSEKPFHIIDENKDTFYYVVPLIGDNKEIVSYLLLSQPFDSLKKVNQQIWGLVIGSLALAFIVILLLGTRITRHYIGPIEAATNVATELARGNYKARAYEVNTNETGMLSQSINILARNLQDMVKAQEIQQERLTTLIESMGSGLILIDSRGYINLINRTYKEIFNVNPIDYLYRQYSDALQHDEVILLVEEIFMTEIKIRKQMVLSFNIERRHFEVYGTPIISSSDEWKGIVLVFHDITELKKLEQMRQDFVANVSHELKTPITSIKGFSETLLDGAMKDEAILENFLTIILRESDRLQVLIQDLLDLSKIEQPGFSINFQKVDLKAILEEIIVLLEGKAEEKQVKLELQADEESIIEGDLYRLKQIFINLINNAIAYTPSNGEVCVSINKEQDKIQVVVADTGIGITQNELPRIFERFYRIDKARSRNSGGTGLGLAIVKHLVDAHHGSIKVTSSQGKGTTFIVSFNR